MRVLCVGRHPYLSEHLGRFFGNLGVDCTPCVGLAQAIALVPSHDPDAVICDYDLLATASLAKWESDPVLADVPVDRGEPHSSPRRRAPAGRQRHRRLSLPADARPGGRAAHARRRATETTPHHSTEQSPVAGHVSGRAAALTGAGDDATAFFPAQPLLDALTSSSADGASRRVVLGTLFRSRDRSGDLPERGRRARRRIPQRLRRRRE